MEPLRPLGAPRVGLPLGASGLPPLGSLSLTPNPLMGGLLPTSSSTLAPLQPTPALPVQPQPFTSQSVAQPAVPLQTTPSLQNTAAPLQFAQSLAQPTPVQQVAAQMSTFAPPPPLQVQANNHLPLAQLSAAPVSTQASTATLASAPVPFAPPRSPDPIPVRAIADEIDVRAEDLLAPQSNGGAFEGARDQPVQYMNYRRPVVQDSRPAVSATKTVDGEDKMQAYVQSKATGSFVKLSKEQLQDLEQQTGGADALNIEDLPTLDGADEVQAANLKLQQSTGNIFLFIHGCLAGFAILQFYLVYRRTSDTDFLSYYAFMSREIYTTYYGITMIAVVSALSRFMLRIDNHKRWDTLPLWTRLRTWCFMLVYLVTFICLIVCDEVDAQMYFSFAVDPKWYSVAASVTAIASKLQYWYILCAVRFVMCMFGGVLAILEFEERLTIADIDFATPKDRFV